VAHAPPPPPAPRQTHSTGVTHVAPHSIPRTVPSCNSKAAQQRQCASAAIASQQQTQHVCWMLSSPPSPPPHFHLVVKVSSTFICTRTRTLSSPTPPPQAGALCLLMVEVGCCLARPLLARTSNYLKLPLYCNTPLFRTGSGVQVSWWML
jgi:hypothetical protein